MPANVKGPATEVFAAMGSRCQISLTGTHGNRGTAELLHLGKTLVVELEQRWSRFLSSSDVSAINARPGEWISVHRHTRNVLMMGDAGRSYTDGRYNPLVGADLVRLGYSTSFDAMNASRGSSEAQTDARTHAAYAGADRSATNGDIEINESADSVRIPADTMVDLGGIAKGYAADLVVDALLALGATGVMVNLGGDVRVAGECPDQPYWSIQVGDREEVVLLEDGAVAFSSTDKRRWQRGGRWFHHLVDPASGSSVPVNLPIVCVVSASGWWSEVLTKSIAVHIGRELATNCQATELSRLLCQAVPAGVHALVSVEGMVATTGGWDSVSARLELVCSQ